MTADIALAFDGVFERVKAIIADDIIDIDREKIAPDSRLNDDIGLDSLQVVELVLCLEQEYGITITDEQSERMRTMADVVVRVLTNNAVKK